MTGVRTTISLIGFDGANPNTLQRLFTKEADLLDQNVEGVASQTNYLAPSQTVTLKSGEVGISAGANTAFSIVKVPSSTNMRLLYSAGTKPVFRTERTIALGSTPLATVVVAANGVATWTFSDVTLTGVVEGDVLWIQGAAESFSSPFQSANQGLWTILSVSGLVIQAVRQNESDGLIGKNQSNVALTANSVRAFSASGVLVGDVAVLASPFPAIWRQQQRVLKVTPDYLDIKGGALPTVDSLVIGTTGLTVVREPANTVFLDGKGDKYTATINGESASIESDSSASVLYANRFIHSVSITNPNTTPITVESVIIS